MKKRILSALLISALMLSMTACGESDKTTDSDDSSGVTTTTIAKEDDVSEATTTTTSTVTEDDGKEETTTSTEEETKPDEEIGLPDGPVNPTLRTSYTVTLVDYESFINGSLTLEELCAKSSLTYDEAIEYTEQGYITTARYDNAMEGISHDSIITYNHKGEIVHLKDTGFDAQNPDGIVILDADYVQDHFKEGSIYGTPISDLEATSDGTIASFIEESAMKKALGLNHVCIAGDLITGVVHEDNRTIIYVPETCDVFNVETRENSTAIANGCFEMITYNSDGKIEAFYCNSSNKIHNGIDNEGNSYATIQEYADYVISKDINGLLRIAEWTYDENGNLLSVKTEESFKFYLYE